eukprot:s123_g32.t1
MQAASTDASRSERVTGSKTACLSTFNLNPLTHTDLLSAQFIQAAEALTSSIGVRPASADGDGYSCKLTSPIVTCVAMLDAFFVLLTLLIDLLLEAHGGPRPHAPPAPPVLRGAMPRTPAAALLKAGSKAASSDERASRSEAASTKAMPVKPAAKTSATQAKAGMKQKAGLAEQGQIQH